MILAEINFTDVIWSMLVFFFFIIIFLWMIFGIIGDIFRSEDPLGVTKALWCIALVFLPWLTIFIYLVVRGSGMAQRSMKADAEARAQFDTNVRDTSGGNGAASEIKSAKERLDRSAIAQEEFDQIEAKALAA